nr:polysaccharide deacetylase family protein [uncultured Roseateles sp.]
MVFLLSGCGGSGGSSPKPVVVAPPPASNPCPALPAVLGAYSLAAATDGCAGIYFESGNSSLEGRKTALLPDLSAALLASHQRLSMTGVRLLVNTRATTAAANATALAGKQIELSLAPEPAAAQPLSFALARAALQTRRLADLGAPATLAEHLVFEGLALAFATEVSGLVSPQTQAIDASAYAAVQAKALAELDAPLTNRARWFDGSAELPRYAGQTLGHDAVQRYLAQHPGSRAGQAYAVAASEIAPYVGPVDAAAPERQFKARVFVRTPDISDQIAVAELARQADKFRGDYFLEGLTQQKTVALTFDDGPSPYTQGILDLLARHQVHATFYLIGQNLEQFPDLARAAQAAGHTLANHSWDHQHFSGQTPQALWANLERTSDAFERLLGFRPRLYRPPYGEVSDGQVSLLAGLGIKTILWSIDTRDWNLPSVVSTDIISSATLNAHGEAMVLMHDGGGVRSNTVQALEAVILYYKAQGYRFVTVDQMIGVSKGL